MTSHEGIAAIRRGLSLDAAAEATIRAAGPRLLPEVEAWVDRFYARLVTDATAMALLGDEARVVRLKRSLTAWFSELFSLPLDDAYARAREEIGRVHVRIGMPQHLMVTSMGGVRRDVGETVDRLWHDDPQGGARVREAVEKALDLELALMLDAYRRRSLEVARQGERALFAGQLARWVSEATREAATAGRCYAELLRRAGSAEAREHWGARLRETLDGIERLSRPASEPLPEPEEVAVAAVLERAVAGVSLPGGTRVERAVDPPDARGRAFEGPLGAALQEMVQGAANRDPGGTVRVLARREGPTLTFEVRDSGPDWPDGVHSVEDAVGLPAGLGLALCRQVAALHGGRLELFSAGDGGGAGIRLSFVEVATEDR
jgi:signal transduction histidine kinase